MKERQIDHENHAKCGDRQLARQVGESDAVTSDQQRLTEAGSAVQRRDDEHGADGVAPAAADAPQSSPPDRHADERGRQAERALKPRRRLHGDEARLR